MNHYEFFMNKLKAMHVQGYPVSKILDEWRKGLPDVLIYLDQKKVFAILQGDTATVKKANTEINYITTLDSAISNGLFETARTGEWQ